ncbi:bifunctional N-acetylglucosamine-1-phosphate uridyltransferase/glucosamine-1-phosphate acetyltransferase [Candidatus Omnitrophota bacterium]
MKNDIQVIILAAGKGTRMKSDVPKVMHQICHRPMISFVLDTVKAAKLRPVTVVVGYKDKLVRAVLDKKVKVVKQKRLLGTADAVKAAASKLKSFQGDVLVLYADNPLLSPETISQVVRQHKAADAACTLLTATVDNARGYGRVVRGYKGDVLAIVEEKDATDQEKQIKEISVGVYCFKCQKLLWALNKVKPNNQKKEFYLTDVVAFLSKEEAKIEAASVDNKEEALGINSRYDLAEAARIMRLRIIAEFMQDGIEIVDPHTTYIAPGATIGKDTIIYPFSVIEDDVTVGKNCSIGPFCHLRPQTVVKDNVIIGNFTELIRTSIDSDSLAKHFSYLGDAAIGKRVNIGAGVVTANFDGKKKHKTSIKDDAFVGSDTVLIAPIKVGKKAITGAGSVVTKNKNVADKEIVGGVPARILSKKKKRTR